MTAYTVSTRPFISLCSAIFALGHDRDHWEWFCSQIHGDQNVIFFINGSHTKWEIKLKENKYTACNSSHKLSHENYNKLDH